MTKKLNFPKKFSARRRFIFLETSFKILANDCMGLGLTDQELPASCTWRLSSQIRVYFNIFYYKTLKYFSTPEHGPKPHAARKQPVIQVDHP